MAGYNAAFRARQRDIVVNAFGEDFAAATYRPPSGKGVVFFQISHVYRFVIDRLEPAQARTLLALMTRTNNTLGYIQTSVDELSVLIGVKKRSQVEAQLKALSELGLVTHKTNTGSLEVLLLDPLHCLKQLYHDNKLPADRVTAIDQGLRTLGYASLSELADREKIKKGSARKAKREEAKS